MTIAPAPIVSRPSPAPVVTRGRGCRICCTRPTTRRSVWCSWPCRSLLRAGRPDDAHARARRAGPAGTAVPVTGAVQQLELALRDDPCGHGNSLEWATSSPPPRHNFVEISRQVRAPHLRGALPAPAPAPAGRGARRQAARAVRRRARRNVRPATRAERPRPTGPDNLLPHQRSHDRVRRLTATPVGPPTVSSCHRFGADMTALGWRRCCSPR